MTWIYGVGFGKISSVEITLHGPISNKSIYCGFKTKFVKTCCFHHVMYLLFWAEAIIYWSEVPRQVHRVEKVIAQKKKKLVSQVSMHYKMARIWLMAVWWQPLNLFWRHSTGAEGSLLAKWKPFDVKNGVKTFNFYPHPIFGNLIIHWSTSFHWRTPARSRCLGDFSHLTLCSNLLVQHCFSCLCGFIIIAAINFCMAGGIEMHITCVLRFSHCVRKMSR